MSRPFHWHWDANSQFEQWSACSSKAFERFLFKLTSIRLNLMFSLLYFPMENKNEHRALLNRTSLKSVKVLMPTSFWVSFLKLLLISNCPCIFQMVLQPSEFVKETLTHFSPMPHSRRFHWNLSNGNTNSFSGPYCFKGMAIFLWSSRFIEATETVFLVTLATPRNVVPSALW